MKGVINSFFVGLTLLGAVKNFCILVSEALVEEAVDNWIDHRIEPGDD